MGLRGWFLRKSKEKQRDNISVATGQAVSSIRFALDLSMEHASSLEAALQDPVVTQTVERHAERIASFSGGPMHSKELWNEVYTQMLDANEQIFEPPFAQLLNGMLQKAYDRAVESGVVTSDPS